MTAGILKVGDTIYGFCNGHFGRDSYGEKVVEGIGPDWVIVREGSHVMSYQGDPQDLCKYRSEPDEFGRYPYEA